MGPEGEKWGIREERQGGQRLRIILAAMWRSNCGGRQGWAASLGQKHQARPKGPQIMKYWSSTNVAGVGESNVWESGQLRVCEKHKAGRGHGDMITRASGS